MDELGATVTEPSSTTSETYINPDGTYKEGWKEALLPEDMRNEKFYDSPFNSDVRELLKTAGNQARMLGKKGVIPLNENSTEFEIQAWRRAHGVPDKYDYQKPDDLQMVDLSDEWLGTTLDTFNKANLSQKQVETVMGVFHDFFKSSEDEYSREETDAINKINQQILQEENTNYDENSQYIDKAVRQFTQGWPEEDIIKLFGQVDSKGGINSLEHIELKPLFRRFLSNIGRSVSEHHAVTGELSGEALQAQLDKIMASEEYLKGYGKPHQDAVNKALKLREMMNANKR